PLPLPLPLPLRLRRYRRLLILAALLAVAAVLVTSVAPRVHRIYYDEDIYGNVAQGMALKGQAAMCNYGTFEYDEYYPHWVVYNKEPAGWPFLVSMAFQLGGVDEEYGFRMNNLLYLGGILICFWIVHIITGRFFPAIMGGLLWAAIPHNLVWSNTMAAEPAAAFFGGLTVLCLLVYLQTGKWRHLFLFCLVVPLACQMRPESGLIGVWAFAAVLVTAPHVLARRSVWATGLLALLFLLPVFLHIHAVSGESWGAEGVKFSLEFFRKNILVNGPYYLDNKLFPAVFTILAVLGLAGPYRRREGGEDAPAGASLPVAAPAAGRPAAIHGTDGQTPYTRGEGTETLPEGGRGAGSEAADNRRETADNRREAAGIRREAAGIRRFALPGLLLLWFVMFWGIFLFFYAGSYRYGADVRFALVSFTPLAVLAGMGADRLRGWLAGLGKYLPAGVPSAPSPPAGTGGAVRPSFWPAAGLIVVIVVTSWLPFLPLVRLVSQEAWGARYDHAYARQFLDKIPRRSVVLTHIPTMLLLWQQGAIQTFAGINNPELIAELRKRYDGHVYFHYNYWCSTGGHHKDLCAMMRERYDWEEVATAREQNISYGLYRITPRGTAGDRK
ncbi:MAG TPA: glycosyltransferase family 39 protein, partial [Syntrophales bacterium]|nr:glycosyltransferase family 39 protein [Syntrophales bacterium]